MARLLQTAQRHDLQQMSDMKARPRAIESDIGGHALLLHECIERGRLRAILIEAAQRHMAAQKFPI